MIEWVVSSCVLILLTMAIRKLFRKRLDVRVRYALWLIVAVRLLVPFSFAESRFSVLNLLDADGVSGTGRTEAAGDAGGVPAAAAGSAVSWGEEKEGLEAWTGVNGDVSAAFRESGDNPGTLRGEQLRRELFQGGQPLREESQGEQPWGEESQGGQVQGQPSRDPYLKGSASRGGAGSAAGRFLPVIWLIGSLLCGTVIFTVNLRDGRKRLRSRVPFPREGEGGLPVYVSGTVRTPCMAGIFRPAIYLTEEALREESRISYIIAHENMHYRHRDHLWAVVRTVCLCVHWFNPLVWMAARLAGHDGELACDADVLKGLGREERVGYGKALLELSIRGSAPLWRSILPPPCPAERGSCGSAWK